MRLQIAAIGKMRDTPELALCRDYIERTKSLGRTLGLTGPDITECEAPKGLTGVARQKKESALLLAASKDAKLVCLDEAGRNLSSKTIANQIAAWRDEGCKATVFLIGGADGHDQSLLARAPLILSFGAATWPHMLVRAMLMEQLYRTMTILSGHPYHRV